MFRSLNGGALGISLPLDDMLGLAHAASFEGLDLHLPNLLDLAARTSVQDLKDRFGASGVRAGAWSVPVDHGADDASYQAALKALPRAAALAHALGSPWCCTVIRPFSDQWDYAANLEHHVARLRPVAQVLADQGCRLGLEFIGPKTLRVGHAHAFIHTLDEALDLGARLGTGNVGLLLDAYHWYTSHAALQDIQKLSARDIVYVHVNDAVAGRAIDEQLDLERELPGASGLIDGLTFMRTVAGTGFDGPVAVEPFNAAVLGLDPPDRARVACESLARIWP